ncbi:MAG: hypothetical protein KDB14_12925 [Planctomycetales bacterium]|nr:hypothetical protein [Planctomycetales bacterium]
MGQQFNPSLTLRVSLSVWMTDQQFDPSLTLRVSVWITNQQFNPSLTLRVSLSVWMTGQQFDPSLTLRVSLTTKTARSPVRAGRQQLQSAKSARCL